MVLQCALDQWQRQRRPVLASVAETRRCLGRLERCDPRTLESEADVPLQEKWPTMHPGDVWGSAHFTEEWCELEQDVSSARQGAGLDMWSFTGGRRIGSRVLGCPDC